MYYRFNMATVEARNLEPVTADRVRQVRRDAAPLRYAFDSMRRVIYGQNIYADSTTTNRYPAGATNLLLGRCAFVPDEVDVQNDHILPAFRGPVGEVLECVGQDQIGAYARSISKAQSIPTVHTLTNVERVRDAFKATGANEQIAGALSSLEVEVVRRNPDVEIVQGMLCDDTTPVSPYTQEVLNALPDDVREYLQYVYDGGGCMVRLTNPATGTTSFHVLSDEAGQAEIDHQLLAQLLSLYLNKASLTIDQTPSEGSAADAGQTVEADDALVTVVANVSSTQAPSELSTTNKMGGESGTDSLRIQAEELAARIQHNYAPDAGNGRVAALSMRRDLRSIIRGLDGVDPYNKTLLYKQVKQILSSRGLEEAEANEGAFDESLYYTIGLFILNLAGAKAYEKWGVDHSLATNGFRALTGNTYAEGRGLHYLLERRKAKKAGREVDPALKGSIKALVAGFVASFGLAEFTDHIVPGSPLTPITAGLTDTAAGLGGVVSAVREPKPPRTSRRLYTTAQERKAAKDTRMTAITDWKSHHPNATATKEVLREPFHQGTLAAVGVSVAGTIVDRTVPAVRNMVDVSTVGGASLEQSVIEMATIFAPGLFVWANRLRRRVNNGQETPSS